MTTSPSVMRTWFQERNLDFLGADKRESHSL